MTYEENIQDFIIYVEQNAEDPIYFKDARMIAKEVFRLQAENVRSALEWSGEFTGDINKYLIDLGLIDPTKCNSCNVTLTTDDTGTYCDNHNCNKFWQTK